jgi:hypothetical protein
MKSFRATGEHAAAPIVFLLLALAGSAGHAELIQQPITQNEACGGLANWNWTFAPPLT